MKLSTLILGQRILDESKCAIYNTLLKFRPDLKDEMDQIPGRDVGKSIGFLKSKELWDETAEKYLGSFMHWLTVYQQGPDEWSAGKRAEAQDRLMCYVAKLIRQSASG